MNNPQIQQIKNMMKQMQSASNPQVFLQNMIAQNPVMQQAFNAMRMSNASPQQFAQMLAQQKGVDLNALIQALQS